MLSVTMTGVKSGSEIASSLTPATNDGEVSSQKSVSTDCLDDPLFPCVLSERQTASRTLFSYRAVRAILRRDTLFLRPLLCVRQGDGRMYDRKEMGENGGDDGKKGSPGLDPYQTS